MREVGGCLNRNFSRAENPWVRGMLVYKNMTSMVVSKVMEGRVMWKEQKLAKKLLVFLM